MKNQITKQKNKQNKKPTTGWIFHKCPTRCSFLFRMKTGKKIKKREVEFELISEFLFLIINWSTL